MQLHGKSILTQHQRIHRLDLKYEYCLLFSLLGIHIVEDTEPAWFPANELREVHGIVPHEPNNIERTLFCIQPDGSEGFCCPTYTLPEEELQEED